MRTCERLGRREAGEPHPAGEPWLLGRVELDLEQVVQELRVARLVLLRVLERGGEVLGDRGELEVGQVGAAVDPALTPEGLKRRAADYVTAADPADGLISPVFADLAGLPPLLLQAGSHEILLSDATRLAALTLAANFLRAHLAAGPSS
jgi:acetyl esterase/lipase